MIDQIDQIVREGARRMLAEALRAKVDAYIVAFADKRDEHDHRLVVRNGCHQPREVLTSAGSVEVTAPRVNDRRVDPDTGERRRFASAILPAWARQTPKIYRGVAALVAAWSVERRAGRPVWSAARAHGPAVRACRSPRGFVPALGQFLGSAKGLSDLRDRQASDQGHQRAGLPGCRPAMAFKLIESAQTRWRAVNAPELVATVRAGATFVNGELVERPDEHVPAAEVFAFLANPDNHILFDTSGMVRGAATHALIGGVGDVFVMNMHNDMKGDHQVENHVVAYEHDRLVGWAPAEPSHAPAGHTWTWRLTPDGAGRTLVSQVHDWSAFTHTDMLNHLPVIDRSQLQRSLDRLAEALTRRP